MGARPARAQDSEKSARRALVIGRALAYDASLASRAGSRIVIGVLYKKGSSSSEKAADEAFRSFQPLAGKRISGLPVGSVLVPYTTPQDLEAAAARDGVDALFVNEGLEAEAGAIKQVCRRRKVLSMGGREEEVRAGISLVVVAKGSRLELVINYTESKQEGAAFGANILRVARVVK